MNDEKIAAVLASPSSLALLAALLLLVLAAIRMKKIRLSTGIITHIGMALALTTVLHAFKLYHLPQGGSITLGGMIPLLLLAYYYGPEVGFLGGFLYGLINLLQDPYVLHPVQVLFDYPLPFMALGLAGYFREKFAVGMVIGVLGRFVCHFISGVVFFTSYAPEGMSPWLYSAVFNASYLVPELVLCLLIVRVLPIKRLETVLHR